MTVIGLLLQMVPLGIAAAFTPSLLAMQVLIVSRDPWHKRAAAVVMGNAIPFVGIGMLFLFGFAQLPATGPMGHDAVDAWLRIVAGVCMWMMAAYLLRPHPGMKQRVEGEIKGYVARASWWVFLIVAFALSLKDISSYIVLAPALHAIAVSPVALVGKAAALILLYALALSPVLVPPLLRQFFGHRMDPVFTRVYRFTLDNQFTLVAAMALAIGAYLLISGLQRL